MPYKTADSKIFDNLAMARAHVKELCASVKPEHHNIVSIIYTAHKHTDSSVKCADIWIEYSVELEMRKSAKTAKDTLKDKPKAVIIQFPKKQTLRTNPGLIEVLRRAA